MKSPNLKGNARLEIVGDISTFESETFHKILKSSFKTQEITIIETGEIEDVVTSLSFEFDMPFDRDFFHHIGEQTWKDLKRLIELVKYRRGSFPTSFQFSFNASGRTLEFRCRSTGRATFKEALEKLAYLVEIVLFQTDSSRLPTEVTRIHYDYDEREQRWRPSRVIVADKNVAYVYDEQRSLWIQARS